MTNCKFEANKLVSIDITHAEINTNSLKKQIFKMFNLLRSTVLETAKQYMETDNLKEAENEKYV